MFKKSFKNVDGCFSALQNLAVIIQTGEKSEIIQAIINARKSDIFKNKKQAQSMLTKLLSTVENGKPEYSIFAEKGNSKLGETFTAFSTLPGVTCPGAGDCLQWCYSYRAWRFCHSFGRMASNCYLLRFHRTVIYSALSDIAAKKKGAGFSLRLYVDGDFSSVDDVIFWQKALTDFPSVQAYGYSKSFSVLVSAENAGYKWPVNYQLNISGGHNASLELLNAAKSLPFVRGEFIALSVGFNPAGKWNTRELNNSVRSSAKASGLPRVFVCPGSCGSCTPSGHACGSEHFRGIPIAIAKH